MGPHALFVICGAESRGSADCRLSYTIANSSAGLLVVLRPRVAQLSDYVFGCISTLNIDILKAKMQAGGHSHSPEVVSKQYFQVHSTPPLPKPAECL